jgi:cell fate regulator YaaT (PSP1 superfamily)
MYEVIQIRLRDAGKISYYLTNGMKFKAGDYCVVEADRGQDYGQTISEIEVMLDPNVAEPLKKVIRKANPWDMQQIDKNKKKIKEVMDTCSKKIRERHLPMKLIDAEFTFDRSKIDFRDLVKDLATAFKARIELKQIGVRDEAKMLGGFGPCGRVLCCATFLKDFEPVTIKMAKEQNLPLNPTKISGLCGRLMCCLSYEHKTYRELMKGLPKEGEILNTEKGPGKVVSINAIKRSATVILENGTYLEVPYK